MSAPHDDGPLAIEDVRFDVYRTGVRGTPVAVRVVHLPTGLVRSHEGRSERQAKAVALEALTAAVASAGTPLDEPVREPGDG
jgi:protein subunit release factor A